MQESILENLTENKFILAFELHVLGINEFFYALNIEKYQYYANGNNFESSIAFAFAT